MPQVRCSKCRGRATLARNPGAYVRLPRCRHCGRQMTAEPVRSSDPHYVVDVYRIRRERGRGMVTAGMLCFPGRGGCHAYSFPHRRGSGYCAHNPKVTDEMLQEREQQGAWA